MAGGLARGAQLVWKQLTGEELEEWEVKMKSLREMEKQLESGGAGVTKAEVEAFRALVDSTGVRTYRIPKATAPAEGGDEVDAV